MNSMVSFNDRASEEYFNMLLKSTGQKRCKLIQYAVNSMIVFFINSFLVFSSLSGYNETNINRILVNYSPSADACVNDIMLYNVTKQFKSLHCSKSHLIKWNSYNILMKMLYTESTIISTADILLTVVFMNCVGIITINPRYFCSVLSGNPFYVKDILCRYWFLKGLRIKNCKSCIFSRVNRLEERKKKYLKDGFKVKLL